MTPKVQKVLDKATREPAFAREILREPRVALAPYELSPEEIERVVSMISIHHAPPPP